MPACVAQPCASHMSLHRALIALFAVLHAFAAGPVADIIGITYVHARLGLISSYHSTSHSCTWDVSGVQASVACRQEHANSLLTTN